MKKVLNIQNGYKEADLKEIATALKNGQLVLFPTETVYGIGTNALDARAVEKIYQAKKRSRKNPINLLVSTMVMAKEITQDISPIEYKLMESFFPGPFTIILRKKKVIPDIVTANSNEVGIRMPNSQIIKKLIEFANVPIAAPSANISGEPSGTDFQDIIHEFSSYLDYAIDGGKSKIGMESTIVKVVDNVPHILRPGLITPKQIEAVVGKAVLEESQNKILPSSNIKHYQLNARSVLVYSQDNKKMIDKIVTLSQKCHNPLVICCIENAEFYTKNEWIKNIIVIGSKNNLIQYSQNLFSSLRKTTCVSTDLILIEGIKKEGLGIAIMNRLFYSCNGNYIEL